MRLSISQLALCLACMAPASAALADSLADQGKALFGTHCAACHNADASGIAGVAPPLAGALRERLATPAGQAYLANVLTHGLAGPIQSQGQSFNGVMPSFATLPDEALAAVLSWLAVSNGAPEPAVNADTLARARAERKTPGAVRKLREAGQ
ncbi:cytochrome c, class I [Cupriavidus basilensis OR16]|uniref:Cytochrome c, class I n=1 Tax=Cupriavidus basilensis OR16 TaxID=1127483 RepID=H1SHR3_9BURK|nr:cytochrome c [Cupriavidus basilensis]EHP37919.1 cytochrome c, class I [Cupriavidus basilensis OR16]